MSQDEFESYQGNAGPGYHFGPHTGAYHGHPSHKCGVHCPQYGHMHSASQMTTSADLMSQAESRKRVNSNVVPEMTGRFARGGEQFFGQQSQCHHHQCGEVRVHDHTLNEYGQPIIILHTIVETAPAKPAEIVWKYSDVFAKPGLVLDELKRMLEGGRHKIVSLKIEQHKHEYGVADKKSIRIEYLFKVEISVPTASDEVNLYKKLRVGISPASDSENVSNYQLVNLFLKILYKTIKME